MFKLAVLFAVIAVAAAKPGLLAAVPAVETRTDVIGESTIESHGNSVVHAAAPVTTSIHTPAVVESKITYSVIPRILHYPWTKHNVVPFIAPEGYAARYYLRPY